MQAQQATLRERILDNALEQAEATSWERLRLHAIADELDITLEDIRRHYPQKDDLVEAWFDRADQALLGTQYAGDFPGRPLHKRLDRVIVCWLDALASHHRLTREMLAYKFEPGHVHLQVLGVLRISRTVQWFLEAAGYNRTGLQRVLDECAVTMIYLTAFARWLFDESREQRYSKAALSRALYRWRHGYCRHTGSHCGAVKTRAAQQHPVS